MKRSIGKTIACVILFLLSAWPLTAQTYPDYALAASSNSPIHFGSLIRVYSPSQALVYYKSRNSGSMISLIDLSGGMKSVPLQSGYEIYDMEIADNYLFMCGQYNLSKAFLAWLDITDLVNSGTATITYQVANSATVLKRMVAYTSPSGIIKVVAIGNNDYHDSHNNIYPPIWEDCVNSLGGYPASASIFSPCTPAYTCTLDFVVEFDNPQQYTTGTYFPNFKATSDNYHTELIGDVVETNNYIVFVSNENIGNDNLVLHRCDKENVLATFDNYYKFPVPVPEGYTYYLCCHMDDDTIGVVSRGGGASGGHETRIRVIDAASMVMTSSQVFDLNGYKTDPTDMIYCKGKHTLVLLQQQKFPPSLGGAYYSFLHIMPYISGVTTYLAEGMVEYSQILSSNPLPFNSLDRLPDGKHYVSSGGECWLMNNSMPGMTTTNCRLVDKINVNIENNTEAQDFIYQFYNCKVKFDVTQDSRAVVNGQFSAICYNN